MDSQTLTEQILKLREETDAFQQSIKTKSEKLSYTFYDGPPFTSGDPHYGHLLQSIVKDMVPRRMAMRGYRVARKRGWDCHGIPAENFVNKELGITSRKQVEEEFGIQNYIEACRNMVNKVNDNRKRTIDRVGRWVDMENAYFTMDNDFMESVINVFSDLYHRNIIYKGFKVLGYSRALGTALSNSEIAEGYEMRQDPAVTVKFVLNQTPIEVAAGIIQDGQGRYLMLQHNKLGVWFFPGGKLEQGESAVDALRREIQEECGVAVTHEKFVGHVKTLHHGVLYRMHYFTIQIEGTPSLQEYEKHGMMERVEIIPAENSLGYVVKFDDMIITDERQLRHDFADLAFVQQAIFEDSHPGDASLGDASVAILPWTTTPRTLPANMFAAVHQDIDYTMLYDAEEGVYFILATACISKYYKKAEDYRWIGNFKGKELLGMGYTPLYEYYEKTTIAKEYKEKIHHILHADFVTTESGTGIVHEAPAFGADDYDLICTVFPKDKAQEWLFDPVNAYGEFTELAADFAGQNVIEANTGIIKDLKQRGLLVKQETINHSYPHCPRTGTPLIYKAIESWFVKEDELKAKTLPSAETMHFVPEGVKQRFINGLASAPDRNISRTRFWGCPLPVWISEDGAVTKVVGSLEELYQANKAKKQITKIILLRHGRSDYNELRILDSEDKARLHAKGLKQANALVSILESHTIDAVYCSPFERCKQTLAPYAVSSGKEVFFDERLREVVMPAAQDKDNTYTNRVYAGGLPVDKQNGESLQDVEKRVVAFYEEILKNHVGQTVVICSHGDPLLLLRGYIRGFDYDTISDAQYPKNADPLIEYVWSDSGKMLDLHRPYIDHVVLVDETTAKELRRIPEVLDCWFESGSMPYGQDHFMKQLGNKQKILGESVILVDAGKGIINCDDDYSLESYSLNKQLADYLASLPNKKIVVTNVSGQKREKMEQLLQGYGFDFFSLDRNPSKAEPVYFRTLLQQYGLSPDQIIYFDHNLVALQSAKQAGIVSVFQNLDVNAVIQFLSEVLNLNSGISFTNCSDFIAEGLDQTRGWFRALHVLGQAYHGQNVFNNVVVTGMILAEDGKKMSKRLKNYPDPSYLLNQYGADALRLYLLSSPVVRAEPLRFSEKAVEQMLKDVVIPLQNVFNFFKMYAEVDGRKDDGTQVWFMRHALKQMNRDDGTTASEGETFADIDLPLSDAGFAQLQSKEFIEDVVRIDPEVIICSDFLRARQTTDGVVTVMKNYLGKDIDVVYTPDRGLGAKPQSIFDAGNSKEIAEYLDTARGIGDIYTELLNTYKGKRVLIVSHKRRLRYLGQYLFDLHEDVNSVDMRTRFGIESASVMPLVTMPLHNELDQRVVAELHRSIMMVDEALAGYHLETATKEVMSFVEKLTNWYLRRSRRRFWTETMDADKMQAYTTLFTVLRTYLQLCAPFIPFVTEQIRQELQQFTSSRSGVHPSIHLQARPHVSRVYVNEQLIEEVATVRKVIKGALYLRAKHQVKVKQPLQKLEIRL